MKIIDDFIQRYPALSEEREAIEKTVTGIIKVFQDGGTLFLCGNGGSAADCAHITGELRKSFVKKRKISTDLAKTLSLYGENGKYLAEHLEVGLPVVNLVSESALSSAYINDNSAPAVFAQSFFGMAKKNDALLTISTSGNSRNCVLAAITAKAVGCATFALTGKDGGQLKDLCDITIKAPEKETYKVQEYHLPIYHAICLACEDFFFPDKTD